jgi:hypothetical protein
LIRRAKQEHRHSWGPTSNFNVTKS